MKNKGEYKHLRIVVAQSYLRADDWQLRTQLLRCRAGAGAGADMDWIFHVCDGFHATVCRMAHKISPRRTGHLHFKFPPSNDVSDKIENFIEE